MASKILIFSRGRPVHAALQRVLVGEGWAVEVAVGLDEGLNRLGASEPDLVVLAAVMTAEEEWGFVRQLRKVSDVPLIIIGGRNDLERRVRSLKLGTDDYVVHPLGLEELKARIHAILRRRSGSLRALSTSSQEVRQ